MQGGPGTPHYVYTLLLKIVLLWVSFFLPCSVLFFYRVHPDCSAILRPWCRSVKCLTKPGGQLALGLGWQSSAKSITLIPEYLFSSLLKWDPRFHKQNLSTKCDLRWQYTLKTGISVGEGDSILKLLRRVSRPEIQLGVRHFYYQL